MNSDNLDSQIEYDLEQEILYTAIEEKLSEKEDSNEVTKDKEYKSAKRRRNQKVKKQLRSGLQIKTILILLVTLLVNTYAWFIYISTVSASISMHIKDWKFELLNGDQTENFEFRVDQIYPGVKTKDTVQEIDAKNSSTETVAVLTCDVKSVKIFEDEYKVGDTYIDADGVEKEYDSSALLKKMLNDYPFKIQIMLVENANKANEVTHLYDGESEYEMTSGAEITIRIQVVWPYESTPTDNTVTLDDLDAIDTLWGNKSYEFAHDETHKDEDSIVVKMDIKAVQKNDSAQQTP